MTTDRRRAAARVDEFYLAKINQPLTPPQLRTEPNDEFMNLVNFCRLRLLLLQQRYFFDTI